MRLIKVTKETREHVEKEIMEAIDHAFAYQQQQDEQGLQLDMFVDFSILQTTKKYETPTLG